MPQPAPPPFNLFRWLLLALPYVWLVLLFLVPLLLVARIALSHAALAQPPYAPQLSLDQGVMGLFAQLKELSLDGFSDLFADGLYVASLLTSLRVAAISTFIALIAAYPVALAIARSSAHWRGLWTLLAIAPFWTSFLIRIYAWVLILKDEGLLNHALLDLHLIAEPLPIFATETAVIIGIVYSYFPFMLLPIIQALSAQDSSLLEAAADLGATRLARFWTITFPLSRTGMRAGVLLMFIPAMGEVVIPDILGGSDMLMIGRSLWNDFFANRDWPTAACAAILLLCVLIVPIVLYQRNQVGALRSER